MYRNYSTSATAPTTSAPRATPDPVDLFATALHLHHDGSLAAAPARMADGDDEWQLATFHVETDADVHADFWEVHPASDEAVWCVRGALRIHFRATGPGAPEVTVRLRTGEAVIVPRATWHRFETPTAVKLLSITPQPSDHTATLDGVD